MNPQNLGLRAFSSISSTGTVPWYGLTSNLSWIDYPEVGAWTFLLDATTNAFNGTVNLQLASSDVTLATIVTPANIMLNGAASATFNQPAAFAGSGVLLWVLQFPLPPWRLQCTAYTSGILRLMAAAL